MREKTYKTYSDYGPAPWTPWGKAQDVRTIERGVAWVGTASHGGLRVAEGVAKKKLSAAARACAEHSNGYFWFEEDCLHAIAFYEQPQWRAPSGREGSPIREDYEETIRRSSNYFDLLRDGVASKPELSVGMRLALLKPLSFSGGHRMPIGETVIVKSIERSNIVVERNGQLYRMRAALYTCSEPYLAAVAA